MISTLTLKNVAATDRRTHILAPKGPAHIEGPSASGKSTVIHALLCLLCGDAPNRRNGTTETTIEAVTGKGTALGVRATKSGVTYTRNGEPIQKAAYMAALGPYGGENVRLILAPMAWRSLAGGTAQPLRDALAKILPAGDVPGRVRAIMGDDWREGDPCDVKGAAEAQTEANATKSRAEGREQEARNALARVNAAPPAGPSAEAVLEAATTLRIAAEWRDYNARAAAWIEHDHALAAWQARAPGPAPEYDVQAHTAARMLVERLEREAAAEREANLQAEAGAAAVVAERERAAREAAAAKVAENARRDAERDAAVKAAADQLRPRLNKVCPKCGQEPNARGKAIDDAVAVVNECREDNETDLRSVRGRINNLRNPTEQEGA